MHKRNCYFNDSHNKRRLSLTAMKFPKVLLTKIALLTHRENTAITFAWNRVHKMLMVYVMEFLVCTKKLICKYLRSYKY